MVVLVAAEVEVVVIMVVPVVHKDDSFKLGSLRIYVLHNSLSKKSREYRLPESNLTHNSYPFSIDIFSH